MKTIKMDKNFFLISAIHEIWGSCLYWSMLKASLSWINVVQQTHSITYDFIPNAFLL